MTDIQIALAILASFIGAVFLFGFVIGRVTKRKPAPLAKFDLTDKQITLIAYEASRAYRIAHGDMSQKSWNNLSPYLRNALVEQFGDYRRNPYPLPAGASPEFQLQAAIVDLAPSGGA